MQKWLITSEYEDVVVALQETEHQLGRIREGHIQGWKWATIALANACCGALVCNLSGSMQIGALTRCHAEKMIAAFEANSNLPAPKSVKLAGPRELLKRARRMDRRLEVAGPPLKLNSKKFKVSIGLYICEISFLISNQWAGQYKLQCFPQFILMFWKSLNTSSATIGL